jgi:hypothetical protein
MVSTSFRPVPLGGGQLAAAPTQGGVPPDAHVKTRSRPPSSALRHPGLAEALLQSPATGAQVLRLNDALLSALQTPD